MVGFDAARAAVDHAKDAEPVSSELRPLLRQVYSDVLAVPADLPALKDSLTRLLEYLSGAGRTLHDTVQTPKVAENFDCLPEQLLERVRKLNVSASAMLQQLRSCNPPAEPASIFSGPIMEIDERTPVGVRRPASRSLFAGHKPRAIRVPA